MDSRRLSAIGMSLAVVITLVGLFVGLAAVTVEHNQVIRDCHLNGYPKVQYGGGEYWCVRRLHNSDEIIPASSLRR